MKGLGFSIMRALSRSPVFDMIILTQARQNCVRHYVGGWNCPGNLNWHLLMVDSLAITTLVIAALGRSGVTHVVVGSFARNFHSFPRSTKDADIVLAVDLEGLSRFEAELGLGFSLDSQTTFETNTGTFRHTLVHKETEFKTELFILSKDAFDQERFHRRLPFHFNGHPSFVLTAEDVIVSKLRWLRAKDIEDIRDVIAAKGGLLDWNYIHHWATIHGTRVKLDEIRASIPKID